MDILTRFYDCFDSIRNESSRNAKLEIFKETLDDLVGDPDLFKFKELLHYLFSGRITFGKSGIPEDYEQHYQNAKVSYKELISLLESLRHRKLTGNAARAEIINLVQGRDRKTVEVVQWILQRDPKAGFSVKSVNSCLDEKIPVFEQQKPTSLNVDSGDGLKRINWDLLPILNRYMVETKIDGNRAYLLIPKDSAPYFLSSNGHEIISMTSLAKNIADWIAVKGIVLDGELFYKDVSETGSIVRKKDDQGLDTGMKFYCMGALTMQEWERSFTDCPGISCETMRARVMKGIMNKEPNPNFTTTACKIIDRAEIAKALGKENVSDEVIQEHIKKLISNLMEGAIKMEWEGLVIKDANHLYSRYKECREGWWKAKFIDTYDAIIVDFQEGTGKNIGKLGAFIVDYKGVLSNVGGSFKDPSTKKSSLGDKERLEYWINRNELTDKTIRVASYGITKDGRFRHASFLNFHGEK